MRKIYLLSFSLLVSFVVSAQFNKSKQKASAPVLFEKGNFTMPPGLNAPGCDTLLWSSTTIQQYGAAAYVADDILPYDSGVISGVNAYNDRQKGNYFDVSGSVNSNYVTKVRYAFARAKSSDMAKTIYFRVYNVGTDTTLAGSSPALPLSSFTGVVGGLADYTFPTPIPLATKRFFISVDFSNLSFAANDSFFLFQNSWATSLNAPDSAVEQFANGRWLWSSVAWNAPPMFFYLFPYVSDNQSCALPVTMAHLNAAQTGLTNQLKWSTKTEIGNKGFEVQRSSDGQVFTKIDFVASKAPLGNSTLAIEYEFSDNSPNSGANYYRIKQVDQNGKLAFSNIALLNRSLGNMKGIITSYPNPVKSTLNLQLASTEQGNNFVSIVNMGGLVVAHHAVRTTGSLQNISVNVSTLPKGTYIVRLTGESKTAKFVKE